MRRALISVLLLSAAVACAQGHISDAKDITAEIVLTGATTVPMAVKQSITQEINKAATQIGSIDSPEFLETIRDLFQQHGYFRASVGDPQWGPIQGDGKHRHVRITVAVDEGSLYKVGTITFKDNKAVDSQTLRSRFPLMKADIFNVEKLRSGLKELKNIYCSQGYIDATPVPNVEIDNGTKAVDFVITLDEGAQYRVGELFLSGQEPYPGAGKALLEAWGPHKGEVFDCHLFEKLLIDYNKRHGSDPDAFSDDRIPIHTNRETKTVDLTFEFPDPK